MNPMEAPAPETVLSPEHIQRIRRFAQNLSLKLPIRVHTARVSTPGHYGRE